MQNSGEEKIAVKTVGGMRTFEKPLKQSLISLRSVIRHFIENTKIVYGNPWLEESANKLQDYVTEATASCLGTIIRDITDDKILDVDIENNRITINSDRIDFMEADVFDLIPMAFAEIQSGYWFDVFDNTGDQLAVIVYNNGPIDVESNSFYGLETIYIPTLSTGPDEEQVSAIAELIKEAGGDKV